MLEYIFKRILFMIPLLLGITIVCFFVMHLAPGLPTDLQTQMNPKSSIEMKERLKTLYELDKPVHEQYWSWLKKLGQGNLGISFSSDHRPVVAKIMERLPITVILEFLSLIIIIAIAVPIGVLSAVRQDSIFDKVTGVLVFIGFAVPTFWLALLLMIFSAFIWAGCRSPVCGRLNYEYLTLWAQFVDLAKHLVLPVFISAFGGLAGLSRYMRANMLEVIRQDYITRSRAGACRHARADVGTTVIVQLFSFNVAAFSPVLILIGVLMFRRDSTPRTHDLSRVFIGFGLMLLALHQLLELTTPYEDAPSLRLLLGAVSTVPLSPCFSGCRRHLRGSFERRHRPARRFAGEPGGHPARGRLRADPWRQSRHGDQSGPRRAGRQ